MLKQIQERKIAELERQLMNADRVIQELIGGLDCPNVEIRALIRDLALSYLQKSNIEINP